MKNSKVTYRASEIKNKYNEFTDPIVAVFVNDKEIGPKSNLVVSDVEIELSSGYEASIASFVLYNSFDNKSSKFLINETKNYIMLGLRVEIALGYSNFAEKVFKGFISRVSFFHPEEGVAGIRVTAMDVKGIMMANCHSRQLQAKCYSEAVREVLSAPLYKTLGYKNVIEKDFVIDDTPDKQTNSNSEKATDKTIEMVGESDYEFIVKAAKKYNFEFYVSNGTIIFRKAKSRDEVLINLEPESGLMKAFDVEYDMTGLIETVYARGMDIGTGKLIKAKVKTSNKISQGSRAKSYLRGTKKVYIDPSITSQEEADSRAKSLMEDISYRYGTLECTCIGLPELKPGFFIRISEMGGPLENDFYIVKVKHVLSGNGPFETLITAKAATIGGN